MNAIPTPKIDPAGEDSRQKRATTEGGQRLVSQAPFLALLARIEADANAVERRAPHSDLISCLRSHAVDLKRALDESRDVNVWLTVDDVAEKIRRPASTLRSICRRFGAKAGARKQAGAWSIHWPTFEAFWNSNNHQLTEVKP